MIILHLPSTKKDERNLEEQLQDLVLAYQKIEHGQDEIERSFIEEDGEYYKTDQEISRWFRSLQKDLSWQRSLSGDGCYIDPESGEVC